MQSVYIVVGREDISPLLSSLHLWQLFRSYVLHQNLSVVPVTPCCLLLLLQQLGFGCSMLWYWQQVKPFYEKGWWECLLWLLWSWCCLLWYIEAYSSYLRWVCVWHSFISGGWGCYLVCVAVFAGVAPVKSSSLAPPLINSANKRV